MNLPGNVRARMEYIQKLFLNVERSVEEISQLDAVSTLLDLEPSEFRSVAYESASMTIGTRDLCTNKTLNHWKEFRQASSPQHSFHMDIGLGWAFARTDLKPDDFLATVNPVVKWMVFDGLGYYHALFKGRNTIKNKIIPEGIEGMNRKGFDQGIGRRLWYMAKGGVSEFVSLLESFHEDRRADLWRGAGIACGYVGGNTEDALEGLSKFSGASSIELKLGIVLAAVSRIASHSVNEDVKVACRIVCNKTIDELTAGENRMPDNFFYLHNTDLDSDWPLSQFESYLGKQIKHTSL